MSSAEHGVVSLGSSAIEIPYKLGIFSSLVGAFAFSFMYMNRMAENSSWQPEENEALFVAIASTFMSTLFFMGCEKLLNKDMQASRIIMSQIALLILLFPALATKDINPLIPAACSGSMVFFIGVIWFMGWTQSRNDQSSGE